METPIEQSNSPGFRYRDNKDIETEKPMIFIERNLTHAQATKLKLIHITKKKKDKNLLLRELTPSIRTCFCLPKDSDTKLELNNRRIENESNLIGRCIVDDEIENPS